MDCDFKKRPFYHNIYHIYLKTSNVGNKHQFTDICFFFLSLNFFVFVNHDNIAQYNTATLNRKILHEFKYNKNVTNFEMNVFRKREKYINNNKQYKKI